MDSVTLYLLDGQIRDDCSIPLCADIGYCLSVACPPLVISSLNTIASRLPEFFRPAAVERFTGRGCSYTIINIAALKLWFFIYFFAKGQLLFCFHVTFTQNGSVPPLYSFAIDPIFVSSAPLPPYRCLLHSTCYRGRCHVFFFFSRQTRHMPALFIIFMCTHNICIYYNIIIGVSTYKRRSARARPTRP